ncbi:probable asparagine--tRNA ligase, mitochondrial [Amphibalanus amphitrite]|uniref:probable asparagine--tRNA ligase, mitochondrial n=1 Tax=Amphibalanus amphitrite TaxID=1232801 RepID=UPI001C91DCC5|nr:probable asparagine--tRNA ligase, mitochondrial [Amphibalanus amphitrite]XP_043204729.1 probable asparagine--tRNA ligase, mitochondrial [Amphibalanus amphitrite]
MVGLTRVCCTYVQRSVSRALHSPDETKVTVQGWLRSVRAQKSRVFASINDGLSAETLQLVIPSSLDPKGLSVNSFVQVSGQIVHTPSRPQPAELKCHHVHLVKTCPPEGYPFPARSSPDWHQARQHPHLRSRLARCAAVLRARAAVTRAVHAHMERQGYLQVDTPVLTANDCEGAGHVFTVTTSPGRSEAGDGADSDGSSDSDDRERPFFGRDVYLTVSGQLHLEAVTCGVTHVYTLSPAFRAERSRTRRHLAEFRMLEAELAPAAELFELTGPLEQLTREVTESFLASCGPELELLRPGDWREHLTFLKRLQSTPFARITHAEAVELLRRRGDLSSAPRPDGDLSREHELALLEHTGNTPVFVTDWPAELKPFYMRPSGENTVAAVDLLVPRIGELAGGSLREDCADRLSSRLARLGLSERLDWYVQLRRYGGPPTAGYGLGLERLLLLLTGLEHVRDVVPFPRWLHHCDT